MTDEPTAPPAGAPASSRLVVDVDAVEHAAARIEPVAGALRRSATRLVRTAADPGDPPAGDHVLDLQQAASDALLALSGGLEESAAALSRVARRHAAADAESTRLLRRGEGP